MARAIALPDDRFHSVSDYLVLIFTRRIKQRTQPPVTDGQLGAQRDKAVS